jgi:hypothetical protein
MVFLLIEEQVFGKQESDCHEDFAGSFDFEESLRAPFIPKKRIVPAARFVLEAEPLPAQSGANTMSAMDSAQRPA